MGDRMETEKIGKVTLDYSKYPGRDYYCDGEVEGQLLEIVRREEPGSYGKVIEERRDWPTLYHLSELRGNIIRWIPFDGTEKVLEIGAGPGAVTESLAPRVRSVDCVDLSRQRSLINAYRNRDQDNITIHVGNFADVEPELPDDYDYILLIGVFEYFEHYIDAPDPFRAELMRILPHLRGWKEGRADTGRLVIAIENRLGLKYFAGCREDHTGRFFEGVENYEKRSAGVRTFTRPALERIFADCGARQVSFYYPYPDYKFPTAVYSDRRLPRGAELTENIRNFDRDRMLLFDEKMAWDGITADGLFPTFANSYEAVIGPPLPVTYAKFANDRAPAYRVMTEFVEQDSGTLVVKRPMDARAAEHVRRMADAAGRLRARYAGSGLAICGCSLLPDGSAAFPMEKGRPLEALLDARLSEGDQDGFYALLLKYRDLVGTKPDYPSSDRDMTFANILVDEKTGQWTAIDYEWEREAPMSGQELLLRALTVYLSEDPMRARLTQKEEFFARLGISEADLLRSREAEAELQREVTGGRISLSAFRAMLGTDVIVPEQIIRDDPALRREAEQKEETKRREARTLASVQIYFDRGRGYSEQDSFFSAEAYGEEGRMEITIPVEGDVRRLRVDPALCPCLVLPERMAVSGRPLPRFAKLMTCNGRKDPDGCLVFTTSDPAMEWNMEKVRRLGGLGRGETAQVTLSWQMTGLPSTMARRMEKGC